MRASVVWPSFVGQGPGIPLWSGQTDTAKKHTVSARPKRVKRREQFRGTGPSEALTKPLELLEMRFRQGPFDSQRRMVMRRKGLLSACFLMALVGYSLFPGSSRAAPGVVS